MHDAGEGGDSDDMVWGRAIRQELRVRGGVGDREEQAE
jgi:hypothetical protein